MNSPRTSCPGDADLPAAAACWQPPPHDPGDLEALDEVAATALRWSVRRADGLNANEEADFQRWLHAASAHRAEFDALEDVWTSLDQLPDAEMARLRQEASTLAQASAPKPLANQQLPQARKKVTLSRWRWPALPGFAWSHAVAAGVLALLLDGGYTWYQLPVFNHSYASARGQQLETELPDGSVMTLDTSSSAEVALYRSHREVRLPSGEAMFIVHPDKSRPFHVLAGPMRITVVGTRFAVRYIPNLGDGHVRVAVEEGRVRVAPAGQVQQAGSDSTKQIELIAGDMVEADAQGRLQAVQHQANAQVAGWRQQRVSFEDRPLAEVLQELERYGDTDLFVQDPSVAAMRMNASVDLTRLQDFRTSLPLVLPVRLVSRNGKTEIAPLSR